MQIDKDSYKDLLREFRDAGIPPSINKKTLAKAGKAAGVRLTENSMYHGEIREKAGYVQRELVISRVNLAKILTPKKTVL